MKRIGMIMLAILFTGAVGVGIQYRTKVHAQSVCAANTFSGSFGYNFTGTVYDNKGNIYQLLAVGRMLSDGNGNITSGIESGSDDGSVFQSRTYTGTYTVNADCTGSAVLTYTQGGALNADFVLVNSGREISFAETDTGYIFGGTAKQQ